MAFTRISDSSLASRGATTLPNQPQISATALKEEFDAPAKEIVAPAVNNLMTEIEESGVRYITAYNYITQTETSIQVALNNVGAKVIELDEGKAVPNDGSEPTQILETLTFGEDVYEIAINNYENLSNKPSINNVTLSGNVSLSDIGAAASTDIPTSLSELSEDTTHRVVTDTEKTIWNNKQDTLTAGTNIEISSNTVSCTLPLSVVNGQLCVTYEN